MCITPFRHIKRGRSYRGNVRCVKSAAQVWKRRARVAPRESTAAMSNDLRDKGIQIANQAVEADNAQRYEEAIKGYIKAAEYLLTATKYEKNPVTLKTIRDKVPRRPASQAAARAPLWWHF